MGWKNIYPKSNSLITSKPYVTYYRVWPLTQSLWSDSSWWPYPTSACCSMMILSLRTSLDGLISLPLFASSCTKLLMLLTVSMLVPPKPLHLLASFLITVYFIYFSNLINSTGCDSFSVTFLILTVCQMCKLGPTFELLFFAGVLQVIYILL